MCVQYPAIKMAKSLIIWNIRRRKMSTCNNDVIKFFRVSFVVNKVTYCDHKLLTRLIIIYISNRCIETNHLANFCFFYSSLDVVKQNFSWWKRCNCMPKMIFKIIVSKLQALLWPIRPQIPIHATMSNFTMLIKPCSPAIVP